MLTSSSRLTWQCQKSDAHVSFPRNLKYDSIVVGGHHFGYWYQAFFFADSETQKTSRQEDPAGEDQGKSSSPVFFLQPNWVPNWLKLKPFWISNSWPNSWIAFFFHCLGCKVTGRSVFVAKDILYIIDHRWLVCLFWFGQIQSGTCHVLSFFGSGAERSSSWILLITTTKLLKGHASAKNGKKMMTPTDRALAGASSNISPVLWFCRSGDTQAGATRCGGGAWRSWLLFP